MFSIKVTANREFRGINSRPAVYLLDYFA